MLLILPVGYIDDSFGMGITTVRIVGLAIVNLEGQQGKRSKEGGGKGAEGGGKERYGTCLRIT